MTLHDSPFSSIEVAMPNYEQPGRAFAASCRKSLARPCSRMRAASIGMHHVSEGTCFSAFDAIQSISAIKTPDTTKVR